MLQQQYMWPTCGALCKRDVLKCLTISTLLYYCRHYCYYYDTGYCPDRYDLLVDILYEAITHKALPSLFGGFLNATPVNYIAAAIAKLGTTQQAYIRGSNVHHVLLDQYDLSIEHLTTALRDCGYPDTAIVAPNEWRALVKSVPAISTSASSVEKPQVQTSSSPMITGVGSIGGVSPVPWTNQSGAPTATAATATATANAAGTTTTDNASSMQVSATCYQCVLLYNTVFVVHATSV